MHSLDSAKKNLQNKKFIYLKSKTSSTEQEKIVEAAASLMTQEQKDQVQRHQDKVTTRQENNSPEPGPSHSKGKVVDPREWGNRVVHSWHFRFIFNSFSHHFLFHFHSIFLKIETENE